jgi:hypothetical protein
MESSADRQPLVLLGAGAARDAGIPVATEMCLKFLEIFKSQRAVLFKRVLLFVLGGLALKRGMRGEDPTQLPNIEEVFSAIQMIARRHELEASPFVSSWHPHIEELEATIYREELADILESATADRRWAARAGSARSAPAPGGLPRASSSGRSAASPRRDGRTPSSPWTNEAMLRRLPMLVGISEPAAVDYLRPLVRWAAEAAVFYYRMGVAHESWHLQETPLGPWVIGVTEVDERPIEAVAQEYASSQLPFDRWFKDQVKLITGIDPDERPLGPPTEMLFDTDRLPPARER